MMRKFLTLFSMFFIGMVALSAIIAGIMSSLIFVATTYGALLTIVLLLFYFSFFTALIVYYSER